MAIWICLAKLVMTPKEHRKSSGISPLATDRKSSESRGFNSWRHERPLKPPDRFVAGPVFWLPTLMLFALAGCSTGRIPLCGDTALHEPGTACTNYSGNPVRLPRVALSSLSWSLPFWIDRSTYDQWNRAGFPDSDIGLWLLCLHGSAGTLDRPFMAREYTWTGDTDPAPAIAWRTAGFTPVGWNEGGESARDACAWIKRFPSISPQDAKDLTAAGYSPLCNPQIGSCQLGWSINDENLANNIAWSRAGFTAADASTCIATGVTYDNAVLWKKAGTGCAQVAAWRAAGVDNPATAAKWKRDGIGVNQVRNVESLLQAGYSKNEAISYAQRGMDLRAIKAQALIARRDQRIKQICPRGQVESEFQLLIGNPYGTTGHCYAISGIVAQWLGPDRALVNASAGLVLVDFPKPPAGRIVQIVGRGEGAFTYTSSDGALTTVPRLRALSAN